MTLDLPQSKKRKWKGGRAVETTNREKEKQEDVAEEGVEARLNSAVCENSFSFFGWRQLGPRGQGRNLESSQRTCYLILDFGPKLPALSAPAVTTQRRRKSFRILPIHYLGGGGEGEAAKPFSGRGRTNNAIPVLHAAAADMQCKSLQLSLWEEEKGAFPALHHLGHGQQHRRLCRRRHEVAWDIHLPSLFLFHATSSSQTAVMLAHAQCNYVCVTWQCALILDGRRKVQREECTFMPPITFAECGQSVCERERKRRMNAGARFQPITSQITWREAPLESSKSYRAWTAEHVRC